MRLVISGHLDGFTVRCVTPSADVPLATYRTWDAAATCLRKINDALASDVAATLAKPSLNKEANRGH